MAEWTLKEVANMLDMTVQAIYKKQTKLSDKGYLYKNSDNITCINEQGLEYLKQTQIAYKKLHKGTLNQASNDSIPSDLNIQPTLQKDYEKIYIDSLKEQIEKLEKQIEKTNNECEFYKQKFFELDTKYQEYMNTHMLESSENKKKKSIFNFFKKV